MNYTRYKRCFALVGRERDAGALEGRAALAGDVGGGGDGLVVLLDGGLLQAVEIVDQVVPFDDDASGAAAVRRFAGSFWRTRARKEQMTWPRIAASQEW